MSGSSRESRDAIVTCLEQEHRAGVAYWQRYDDSAFFAPLGAHWSPAEHVRHLTRSMAPLRPALRLPRLALRLLFGRAQRASISRDAMRIRFHAALSAGGTAGRFAPPADDRRSADRRRAIMASHAAVVAGLRDAVQGWDDGQLDACRLPHPLLGRLTVREMLLFTIVHNAHHVDVAERRRLEAGISLG